MKISCSKEHIQKENADGYLADSVAVECSRCGERTESFGTGTRSTKRCLALLNERCPQGENNYYEIATDGGERRPAGQEDTPRVYTAGAMRWANEEDSYWRRSLEVEIPEVDFIHPDDTYFDHGGDLVAACVSEDIAFLRKADAVVAHFTEMPQMGTVTEVFHALMEDKPVLVLFSEGLLAGDLGGRRERDSNAKRLGSVSMRGAAPDHWFLINYLLGDELNSPHRDARGAVAKWGGYDNVEAWEVAHSSIVRVAERWVRNGYESPPWRSDTTLDEAQSVADKGHELEGRDE